jgi:hypothetical protein
MKQINNQAFFNEVSKTLFNGQLNNKQRSGIDYKLEVFDMYDITDNRWRAYMLATSYHETGRRMLPVEEIGQGAGRPYGKKIKYDGTRYTMPDRIYYGRGDVQLTWYENYEMMGQIFDQPLLMFPEIALDPLLSALIMVEGMINGKSRVGDFTGVSLEDYFNIHRDDPFNARRIVNGLDQADKIAGYYYKFLHALEKAALN